MRDLMRSIVRWPVCFLIWVLFGTGVFFALMLTGQKSWIAVIVTAAGALIMTVIWFVLLRKHAADSLAQMSIETAEGLEDRMMQLANPYALISENGKIVWRNEAFDQMLEDYGTDAMVLTDKLGDIFPDAERFWSRWLEQNEADEEEKKEQPEAVAKAAAAGQSEEGDAPSRHYLSLGERVYAADVRRVNSGSAFAALMLSDETEHLQTLIRLQDERNVSGLRLRMTVSVGCFSRKSFAAASCASISEISDAISAIWMLSCSVWISIQFSTLRLLYSIMGFTPSR